MSRIDIVVPCYNYGRYLEACVRSVLDQAGVDVRVLIIDDCSSDDSELVGRRLAAVDSRVEFRRHAVNRGHTATYNEGVLEWANGDFVLLLSADDLLTPGALARAARVLDAHPNVGLVYGVSVVFWTEEPPPLPDPPSDDTIILTGNEFLAHSCRVAGNVVPTPSAVVRTSVQRRIGAYDPALPHTGDFEMWLRCACVSDVAVVKGPQAFYRRHAANMSYQYHSFVVDMRQRWAAISRVLATPLGRPYRAKRRFANRSVLNVVLWEASKELDARHFAGWAAAMRFAVECSPRALLRLRFYKNILKAVLVALRILRSQPAVAAVPSPRPRIETTGWWPRSVRRRAATSPVAPRSDPFRELEFESVKDHPAGREQHE